MVRRIRTTSRPAATPSKPAQQFQEHGALEVRARCGVGKLPVAGTEEILSRQREIEVRTQSPTDAQVQCRVARYDRLRQSTHIAERDVELGSRSQIECGTQDSPP